MPIGSGVYKIAADAKQAIATNQSLGASLKGIINPGTAAAGAVAAVGFAAFNAIKSTVSFAGELHKMNLRTGVSTENLSALKFALEQSGSSLQVFEKGIRTMASFVFDANKGLATQTDALDALGLTLDDINGLRPYELFNLFADAISRIPDPTRQAALAQDVFGGAGVRLLPILLEGSEGMKALTDRARELGIVMDQETANNAAKLEDNLNELNTALDGVKLTLTAAVLPAITELSGLIADIAPVLNAVGPVITHVMSTMRGNIDAVRDAVIGLADGFVVMARQSQAAINVAIGGLELFARPFIDTYNSIASKVPGLGTIDFEGTFARATFADNLRTSDERRLAAEGRRQSGAAASALSDLYGFNASAERDRRAAERAALAASATGALQDLANEDARRLRQQAANEAERRRSAERNNVTISAGTIISPTGQELTDLVVNAAGGSRVLPAAAGTFGGCV